MPENPGKKFEKDLKDSCKSSGIFILRLNDTYVLNKSLGKEGITKRNPCDYIVHYNGILYMIECKSTKYKSMSFSTDPFDKGSPMIKEHQITSLLENNLYGGVRCGFLLNFRDDTTPANSLTYYLPIESFSNFLISTDKKSINKVDIVDNGGLIVPSKLKRTHFYYDVPQMMEDIDIYYTTHEKTNLEALLNEIREASAQQTEDLMNDFCG